MRDEQAARSLLRSDAYAGFCERVCFASGGALALLPPERAVAPELPIVRDRHSMPVSGLLRAPEGLFFGIEAAERVVSWAVAGRPKLGVRLITVETDRQYRGRGLAAQALRALCCEVNEPLLYLCEPANAASRRAAEKAGFTLLGQVFFKK